MTWTPEERAYLDALALEVEAGIYGLDAHRNADRVRGTLWFKWRVLSYAFSDLYDPIVKILPKWMKR